MYLWCFVVYLWCQDRFGISLGVVVITSVLCCIYLMFDFHHEHNDQYSLRFDCVSIVFRLCFSNVDSYNEQRGSCFLGATYPNGDASRTENKKACVEKCTVAAGTCVAYSYWTTSVADSDNCILHTAAQCGLANENTGPRSSSWAQWVFGRASHLDTSTRYTDANVLLRNEVRNLHLTHRNGTSRK